MMGNAQSGLEVMFSREIGNLLILARETIEEKFLRITIIVYLNYLLPSSG